MSIAELKAEIHEYLDLVDERMLKIIRSMIQTDIKEQAVPKWYEEAERERQKYLSGEGKSYTIEEVKANALAAIKNR